MVAQFEVYVLCMCGGTEDKREKKKKQQSGQSVPTPRM
jgi:hypothetical protein